MELAQVQEHAARILDEVERAVVGKRDALELVLMGLLADGHVLLEDYPGLAKTLAARSFAAGDQHRLQPDPVHARPDALRRHRLVDLEPARRRLPLPSGADLHQPPPRRRDQPRATEDPGRAARGDAGAAGHDRGRHPPARPPVPRPRDAEPDRVRGDLSAARGAARPLPAAGRLRLPEQERRVGGALAAARTARGRGRARAGDRRTDAARAAGGDRAGPRGSRPSAATSSSSSRRRGPATRPRSAPARAAASPCSSSHAARLRSRAATSSPRTT